MIEHEGEDLFRNLSFADIVVPVAERAEFVSAVVDMKTL